MAAEVIGGFSAEEIAYFHEISKEKYELDMRAHRADAREEGFAKSREQVRLQDLETVKKMKDRGFSPDEIRDLLPRLTMEDIRQV